MEKNFKGETHDFQNAETEVKKNMAEGVGLPIEMLETEVIDRIWTEMIKTGENFSTEVDSIEEEKDQ